MSSTRTSFGKGKSMDVQAKSYLKQYLDLSSRHQVKATMNVKGSKSTGRIHSVASFNKYTSALKLAGEWAKANHGCNKLNGISPAIAQSYLEHRSQQGIGQKQLDADRNALSYLTGKDSLQRQRAMVESKHVNRAINRELVDRVVGKQSARNALATKIALEAGLRAHELLTLRRSDEQSASQHRTWSSDRFTGRQGGVYVVTGKGGLKREVLIPNQLVLVLEARRLENSQLTIDRGIKYVQYYDIGGGNKWSRSFRDACNRLTGKNLSAHGLRYTYAQERMKELQRLSYTYYEARLIVSQELGHFRGDVVETYLR